MKKFLWVAIYMSVLLIGQGYGQQVTTTESSLSQEEILRIKLNSDYQKLSNRDPNEPLSLTEEAIRKSLKYKEEEYQKLTGESFQSPQKNTYNSIPQKKTPLTPQQINERILELQDDGQFTKTCSGEMCTNTYVVDGQTVTANYAKDSSIAKQEPNPNYIAPETKTKDTIENTSEKKDIDTSNEADISTQENTENKNSPTTPSETNTVEKQDPIPSEEKTEKQEPAPSNNSNASNENETKKEKNSVSDIKAKLSEPCSQSGDDEYCVNLYEPISGIKSVRGRSGIEFLSIYIWILYKYFASIVGIICVLVIVVSGVQISMSGISPDMVSQAKTRIMEALLSLMLLFLSAAILHTINPNFYRRGSASESEPSTTNSESTTSDTPTTSSDSPTSSETPSAPAASSEEQTTTQNTEETADKKDTPQETTSPEESPEKENEPQPTQAENTTEKTETPPPEPRKTTSPEAQMIWDNAATSTETQERLESAIDTYNKSPKTYQDTAAFEKEIKGINDDISGKTQQTLLKQTGVGGFNEETILYREDGYGTSEYYNPDTLIQEHNPDNAADYIKTRNHKQWEENAAETREGW